MSDVAVATVAESTVVIDPATAKPNNAPSAAKTNDENDGKPPWLDERLERAREAAKKEAWKDLGFESPEAAKKAADELKAAAEAKKTDLEKRIEVEKALNAEQKKTEKMAEALKAYATSQMQALNDSQRDAVTKVAGEDPAAQLKTIEALRPTWADAVAAPAAPAVQDTALGRTAPKDGAGTTPPDPKAIHEALKVSNPILAARYALVNGIFETK